MGAGIKWVNMGAAVLSKKSQDFSALQGPEEAISGQI